MVEQMGEGGRQREAATIWWECQSVLLQMSEGQTFSCQSLIHTVIGNINLYNTGKAFKDESVLKFKLNVPKIMFA